MCGIVGAVAQRDVAPLLIEGLKRLEYRGYDSAGIAVISQPQQLVYRRTVGKIHELEEALAVSTPLHGNIGIAHSRWATHGKPSERNAHPQVSHGDVAVVHNGIIENHEALRARLLKVDYLFNSETDTEVVVHLLHYHLDSGKDFLAAVRAVSQELEGAYALAFIDRKEPHHLLALRYCSPLVIGLGDEENFIASDPIALASVAQRFIYLEEGDIADVYRDKVTIYDTTGAIVTRKIHTFTSNRDADKGDYQHYMLKEIFEQPDAIAATLQGRLSKQRVLEEAFGTRAAEIFDRVERVQIVACGTSFHAGMIARYWLENVAKIPCQVEIASEIRYRHKIVEPNTLFVTLSQSGETADTLAALKLAKTQGYIATLAICNVPESSIVRESDLVLMTDAGPEIGVASTKAFTTQLTALLLLTIVLGRRQHIDTAMEAHLVTQLQNLPRQVTLALNLDKAIKHVANLFANKQHALFIGRGTQYPIALEGALKLKEISYIHAEAYPAGELKHGPLALVDKDMPVVALIPDDELLEKMKSNLEEVRTRNGLLIVFAGSGANIEATSETSVVTMPSVEPLFSPIVYAIPLQLLAYHVAVLKGTDIDQPRNLAKSVTVE